MGIPSVKMEGIIIGFVVTLGLVACVEIITVLYYLFKNDRK